MKSPIPTFLMSVVTILLLCLMLKAQDEAKIDTIDETTYRCTNCDSFGLPIK
jgi:hypothetical protein